MAQGFKTGGRTLGSTNKETAEIRQRLKLILDSNLDKINTDLKAIEDPAQRIRLLLDLAKFVIPTLKATELTAVQNEQIRPIVISLGRGIKPEADAD
jgi:hypothetical protein